MNSQLRNADDERLNKGRFGLYSISWAAIIAGGLIGAGISFIFNLFVISIGLTAFVNTTPPAVNSIAIGGVIGLILIAIFSMGTAGWVAGYLGRPKSLHRDIGVIHGFTAWCVAFVLMVSLSGHVEHFISYNIAALQNPSYTMSNVNPNVIHPNITNADATNSQFNQNNQVIVNNHDAAKALAISSFIVFVIFFIGALASCLGGHWGSRSYEKDILYYRDRDITI